MDKTDAPTNIYELMNETVNEYNNNKTDTPYNCLVKVMKKNHFWPSMQVKKFKNNDNLALLHNTYKREDVGRFKEIYEQCRSVVIDFSQKNNNIVVSYANNIPIRINVNQYNDIFHEKDKYQEAYDGTMITVYNYDGEWYFGTSSCPDINSSKFANPNKNHGMMFDEVLLSYFRNQFKQDIVEYNADISKQLRDMFVSHLDPAIAYEFVLVHCDNIHIIDYTNVFGIGYKILYHVNSKSREQLVEIDISNKPLATIGVKYPQYFEKVEDAIYHISHKMSYGFIVKKQNEFETKLYKISPPNIEFKEDTNPCNPNVWHNLLTVYMKNRKDFQINDYISNYNPIIQLPIDDKGRNIDPTYLIHTMISTIKDVLYNLYIATTVYNPKTKRYRMNKELDNQFPPVIRFHLAQLRYRQQYENSESILKPKDVYYYICHCNNIKNIKLLITLFATNTGYNISERASMCFSILNSLL